MRLVIQRVKRAGVEVDGVMVGEIRDGLLVLLGVREGDSEDDVVSLVAKLVKMRIMADSEGKMNKSVKDTGSPILLVSQFTLHADTRKGNRPSFMKAADPDLAKILYGKFIELLKENDIKVQTGEFGAYMNIGVDLDGPVTIILDSK